MDWQTIQVHSGPVTSVTGDQPLKDCQASLAEGAMQQACAILATIAEGLAEEIERGEIADCGGAEALRVLARLVRLAHLQTVRPAAADPHV